MRREQRRTAQIGGRLCAAVAAGRGSGGSSGGSSELSAPVDLSSAQARGSVSLSQGTIDAGGAGSATLGRRERGDS